MERKRLLTVKELAELLNVRPKTVYQWANLSQIPAIKLNGTLRFDVADIISWIEACKKQVESDYNPFVQVRSPGRRK
jgi:excisionase family DNA binding protein